MKLSPAQLGKHLQGTLAPIYVVCGDEHLLCQEACDAIRAATRAQGFCHGCFTGQYPVEVSLVDKHAFENR